MNPRGKIGSKLGFGDGVPGSPVEWQIVGVFRDISNLEQFGDPAAPQICVPFAQSPWLQAMVAVRTAADPEALRKSLAAEVQAIDPDLPLTDVRTMDQIIGQRRPQNCSWAELLHRVFALDVLECPNCCGRMRILAAMNPPEAIRKILDCLGIPSRAPPMPAASREDDGGLEVS